MSKKFVNVRKIIIPVLTAIVLLTQSGVSLAATPADVAQLEKAGYVLEVQQTYPDPIKMVSAASVISTPITPTNSTTITAKEAQAKGEALNLSAVDMTRFTDFSSTAWYNSAMRYAVGMGYIKGTSDTTVAPSLTVTEAQFVTVLVRSCLSPATIDQYAAQALQEYIANERLSAQVDGLPVPTDAELTAKFNSNDGPGWYVTQGIYKAGQAIGIVRGAMGPDATNQCTRAQMATLLVRAMQARGEDTTKFDTVKALGRMSDRSLYAFQSGQYASYGNDIGVTIAAGLIVGDENGNFNPANTMTRAEMAQVLYRLDNPTQPDGSTPRGDTVTTPDTPTPSVDLEAPITIDMRTPNVPHRAPKEGDTVIRPDGTSVVLKRDATTGVLGYGQNVGPYLGTESKATGHLIVADDWTMTGTSSGTWTDPLADGRYMQSPVKGQEFTYHWSGEWSAIKDATWPDGVKGVAGQRDSTGLWKYDGEDWLWQGPRGV